MGDTRNRAAVASVSGAASAPAIVKKVGAAAVEHIGRYRWRICALLFCATTLNYMDRQVLALLKPTLMCPANGFMARLIPGCINPNTHLAMTGIGLTELQFSFIVTVFSAAYALGLLLNGGFIDRVGTKIGYAVAISIWTVAAVSHTFVSFPRVVAPLQFVGPWLAGVLGALPGVGHRQWIDTLATLSAAVVGFLIVRFVLGLGESGNFPAAIKTVAEWFPQKERALATGIFNSGSNIGATLAPFAIGLILYHLGWRYAFLVTSTFSFIWLITWLIMYRRPQEHPKVSPAELKFINSDPPEPETKVPWAKLLPHRQTWAFLVGKSLTDPIWWFYLYWLPGFLHDRYGLSILKAGIPLLVIYNVSAVGSIFGGWLPAKFLSMGWSVNKARKTSMFIYACGVLPIVLVSKTGSPWSAVALISLAAASHQAWSANMFTLASDMFPRRTVASVVGIGAFGGAIVMMFFSSFIGWTLQVTGGNYFLVFLICGSAYLLALLLIQGLAPKLKPANVG
jgi:ACS family hexuronate transporter-like MFS transporter